MIGLTAGSYRPEVVAVQTVAVMIPLDPEVTIWHSHVSVLVAQSPEGEEFILNFYRLSLDSRWRTHWKNSRTESLDTKQLSEDLHNMLTTR